MTPWFWFLPLLAGAAWADDHPVMGPVAPMEEVFKRVAEVAPGARVLKVELEGPGGDEDEHHVEAVYEVKALTPQGGVVKLVFRARDLLLLKERRPPPRHHREH